MSIDTLSARGAAAMPAEARSGVRGSPPAEAERTSAKPDEHRSEGLADLIDREEAAEIGARQAELDALGPLARAD